MEENQSKETYSTNYKEAITEYQVAKERYEYNKKLIDKYNEDHRLNSMLLIKLLTLVFLFFTGVSVSLCYQLYFSNETIADTNSDTSVTDIIISFSLISIIVLGLVFIYLLRTMFLSNYRHESLLYEQKERTITAQNKYLEVSANLIKVSDSELFSIQTDIDLLVSKRNDLIQQKEQVKSEHNNIEHELNKLRDQLISSTTSYNSTKSSKTSGATSSKYLKSSIEDLKELVDKINNLPPY